MPIVKRGEKERTEIITVQLDTEEPWDTAWFTAVDEYGEEKFCIARFTELDNGTFEVTMPFVQQKSSVIFKLDKDGYPIIIEPEGLK